MSYDVVAIPPFDRQLKRLVKKHPSLKKEFADLIKSLEIKPDQGIALGNSCFKIRLAISSKGKGKSGGSRVITNFVVTEATVFLLAIYDKSEKENLTDKELNEFLKFVPQ
jgi:hypothetical protein